MGGSSGRKNLGEEPRRVGRAESGSSIQRAGAFRARVIFLDIDTRSDRRPTVTATSVMLGRVGMEA